MRAVCMVAFLIVLGCIAAMLHGLVRRRETMFLAREHFRHGFSHAVMSSRALHPVRHTLGKFRHPCFLMYTRQLYFTREIPLNICGKAIYYSEAEQNAGEQ
jgi:hypothetical protein